MNEENDMRDRKGFDLWADEYEQTVQLSNQENTYPFAGYKDILNTIYNRVLDQSATNVLDLGFGTGTLSSKLYEQGCKIFGQDFSERMIEVAQRKMIDAKLYQGDLSYGLVEALTEQKYDAVIATYCFHHLTDDKKVTLLKQLYGLLKEDGCIYIGDIAFENRKAMERCREEVGETWDDDEMYFAFDELQAHFPTMQFEQISYCAGLISFKK